MKEIFKKWWFWLIVVLVILVIVALLPIWCNTYYLPGVNQTVIEKTHCGSIFSISQVY